VADSIKAPSDRPAKPHNDFPLFAHRSGQWCKKIRGKPRYFGSWRIDPTGVAALELYTRELPYWLQGETPPAIDVSGGCTIEQLCNEFMESKAAAVEDGDLSPRTLADYHQIVKAIAKHFGKSRTVPGLTPRDFRDFRSAMAKRLNTNSLKSTINKIRGVFKYGHTAKLYAEPIHFGDEFKRPSAKRQRRARNERGPKLFNREDILAMMDDANVHLSAMIYLGCNAGFGNSDCSSLPLSAVELETGWVSFPRPKTEIPRRIPLWPETVKALERSIANRPEPAGETNAGLVFLRENGLPYVRVNPPRKDDNGKETPGTPIDAVSKEFSKLVKRRGITVKGLNFYTLRHCFETYAGESRDQVAVDAIMGHADPSMAANYRHRISDERLQDVVNVVRDWLWPEGGAK
jgi:integrase